MDRLSTQTSDPIQLAELLEEYWGFPSVKAWVYYHAVSASQVLGDTIDKHTRRALYNPRELADNPELVDTIISKLRAIGQHSESAST